MIFSPKVKDGTSKRFCSHVRPFLALFLDTWVSGSLCIELGRESLKSAN